jgi:hypothetical protein
VFEATDPEKTSAEPIATLQAAGYRHLVVVRTLKRIRHAVEDAPPDDPRGRHLPFDDLVL